MASDAVSSGGRTPAASVASQPVRVRYQPPHPSGFRGLARTRIGPENAYDNLIESARVRPSAGGSFSCLKSRELAFDPSVTILPEVVSGLVPEYRSAPRRSGPGQ